ncbi:MAG: DUF819 family protein [Kangiellaceae bacterium]|jgi:uncharacterized membrane protein|nr:DUF819 family protein [Kangiellaceae bacterium]
MAVEKVSEALITSDGVMMGILAICLGLVFHTSQSKHPFWQKFYHYVPALLMCYLLPAILNTTGVINGSDNDIYYVISRFLLPAALVLFILSVDIKKIIALGPKALIMFLAGTLGIVIGGPVALYFGAPVATYVAELFGASLSAQDDIWRGMSTIAGSWIGGGANQAAMKEMWDVDENLFGAMAAIDVIVANIWMAILLIMARKAKQIDERRGANTRAIEEVQIAVEKFEQEHARIPDLTALITIAMIGLGATGLAHFFADYLTPIFVAIKDNPISLFGGEVKLSYFGVHKHFFWLIVFATAFGLLLSFTRAKHYEGAGASKIGSVFIYLLVASIGMHMDLTEMVRHIGVFVIGLIWISIHAIILLVTAKVIKAPTFFLAVGSQANIGGAASAPVVAAAFHPSLAPVGALLAILGYVLGTYAAILCTYLLQAVA